MIAPLERIGDSIFDIGAGLSALIVLTMIGLVIYRYFKTAGAERKQLRWLGFGLLVAFVFAVTPQIFVIGNDPDEWAIFAASFGIVALDATLLTAIGIGILFYRLWDIDVIIRRTFTYAILSALLVGTYLLIVLVFQSLLSGVIASDSPLVLVVSTLTVAVLFNPLRGRVQQVIDRVFYRKRYDANATLETFSNQIRHATKAEAIQKHLVQSVSGTLQPKTVGVWVVDKSTRTPL